MWYNFECPTSQSLKTDVLSGSQAGTLPVQYCTFTTQLPFQKADITIWRSIQPFIQEIIIEDLGYPRHYFRKHAQLYPPLCNSSDCSLPGFSVHGIPQARILDWVAIPFSRVSSWPRNQTCLLCLLHWQANSLSLCHPGSLTLCLLWGLRGKQDR